MVNGKKISMSEWQTQSVRELFFYFLTENRPLTREQIGEVLWKHTDEPARLKLRFKNEMYRLRRAVGQNTILFEHDYYQFNSTMEHEYDVEAFNAYFVKAKSSPAPAEQITFYQKAIDLVRGKYLEDIGAIWVWPERERLSQKFLAASLELAELYFKDGQRPKAIQICQHTLEYDATSEAVYRLIMQIYYRMGDRASIIHTYQTCEEVMQKVFDLPSSDETQELYKKLIS